MKALARALGVSTVLLLTHPAAAAASAFTYPIFDHTRITTPADLTMFVGVTFLGIEERLMFDRRVNAFVRLNAFVFSALFSDGQTIESDQPGMGTEAAARVEAESCSREIGQLPLALRDLLHELVIHDGEGAAGGGRGGVLVHTDSAEASRAIGIWEETLIHEGAHSLDEIHARHPDWIAAQMADGAFISQYAERLPAARGHCRDVSALVRAALPARSHRSG